MFITANQNRKIISLLKIVHGYNTAQLNVLKLLLLYNNCICWWKM